MQAFENKPMSLTPRFINDITIAGGSPSQQLEGNLHTNDLPAARSVKAWLNMFVQPDHLVELRCSGILTKEIPYPVTLHGFYSAEHLDQLALDAGVWGASTRGTYISLNPIYPDATNEPLNHLQRRSRLAKLPNTAILDRRWLLIDIDAVRPAEVSSTDEEKAKTLSLANAVKEHLNEMGWPDPVVGDSGNGTHLLYRIDVPTWDGGLIRRVLVALSERFDNSCARIDKTAFEATHLFRLYSSWVRIGKNTRERPHRQSTVISMSNDLQIVPTELLEMVGNQADKSSELFVSVEEAKKAEKDRLEWDLVNQIRVRKIDQTRHKHRARVHLSKTTPVICGQRERSQIVKAARKLVGRFLLTIDDAFPLLEEFIGSSQIVWERKELIHILADSKREFEANDESFPEADEDFDFGEYIERDERLEIPLGWAKQLVSSIEKTFGMRLCFWKSDWYGRSAHGNSVDGTQERIECPTVTKEFLREQIMEAREALREDNMGGWLIEWETKFANGGSVSKPSARRKRATEMLVESTLFALETICMPYEDDTDVRE